MTPLSTVKKIQDRAATAMSFETARWADCSMAELQQFVGGQENLNDTQLKSLQRYFGLDANGDFTRYKPRCTPCP